MMLSFGQPFSFGGSYLRPVSPFVAMPDMEWVAVPRIRRPMSAFDDLLGLDREMDNLWRGLEMWPAAVMHSPRASSSNQPQATNTEAANAKPSSGDAETCAPSSNAGEWTEMSTTFNTVRQGPHTVSRRIVRVRDGSGRDEMVEERCLDGRKSKRVTNLAQQQQASLGSGADNKEASKEASKEGDSSCGTMTTPSDDFDRLWEQDALVQQWMTPRSSSKARKGGSNKHDKKYAKQADSACVVEQTSCNQTGCEQASCVQPAAETCCDKCECASVEVQPQPQESQPQSQAQSTQETASSAPATPDFSQQLQQLAQLGLPCDSSAYHLLSQTQGSVGHTAMGLLCLQRMKERGFQDEARCVSALCNCNFDLEKACKAVKEMEETAQSN